MSAQTFADAFAPVEAANRAAVQAATFGHLAPERGVTYRGEILFAHGAYGDYTPIDARFEGLPDSPWFYDDLMDWIEAQKVAPGAVYQFTGTYRQRRFRGKVRKVVALARPQSPERPGAGLRAGAGADRGAEGRSHARAGQTSARNRAPRAPRRNKQ